MMDYRELFQRNYGIFNQDEQERLRRSRVLIVGCGGIGGTVAVILARSGVERFILCDFDVYSPTNMNRQIACFADTLGRKKSEVVRETILRINPAAEVIAYTELIPHTRIAELMGDVDFVFPAADDLAFSLIIFRDAQRLGKPALMVFPAGTWAHVAIILPNSPSPEDIEGMPKLASYEELRDMLTIRRYKFWTYFYVPFADWRIDYYLKFIEENAPPTQLCPTVWTASALGAMEILKMLSGKWQPVAAPRYWHITQNATHIQRINGPCLHTLLVWQRRLMWRIFQTPLAPALESLQDLWWKLFYRWMKFREAKRKRTAEKWEEHMKAADLDYRALFARNYGVLTEAEQERIREARVLIIGDTGSGETLCTALARCGFERIAIAGQSRYNPTDMNRQISCFIDTIGRSKVEVMAETIRAINPAAEVIVYPHLPNEEEIHHLVGEADIVIPAVDDLPYSIQVFRICRALGKPAVLCLPAGALGWVSVFTPESVTIEQALGIPNLDYLGLQGVIHSKEYRCAQYHYITQGDWQVEWFFGYFSGKRPLALFCSAEWTLVSLTALEAMKIATGKWRPILAPKCWRLKHGCLKVSHFSRLMRLHRRIGWRIFGSPNGLRRHRLTHYIWKKIFAYLKSHQQKDPG